MKFRPSVVVVLLLIFSCVLGNQKVWQITDLGVFIHPDIVSAYGIYENVRNNRTYIYAQYFK
jgi:hypothetical protein